MPNDKGYYDFTQPLKKTQPAQASDPSKGDHSGKKNTEERYLGGQTAHDFNHKAKVTDSTSNFHDFGHNMAGLKFNGAQKDASIQHLNDRNTKGQEITNFSGGNRNSKMLTNNSGVTAYNNMPIREVYKSATSNKAPPEQPIKEATITKQETDSPGDQTKLGQQVRHSKKDKGRASQGY